MLRKVTKHGTITSRTCYSLVHALDFTFSLFISTLESSERKGVSCNPVLSTAEGIFLLLLNSFPPIFLWSSSSPPMFTLHLFLSHVPLSSAYPPFLPPGDPMQACLFFATTYLGPCCCSHKIIEA